MWLRRKSGANYQLFSSVDDIHTCTHFAFFRVTLNFSSVKHIMEPWSDNWFGICLLYRDRNATLCSQRRRERERSSHRSTRLIQMPVNILLCSIVAVSVKPSRIGTAQWQTQRNRSPWRIQFNVCCCRCELNSNYPLFWHFPRPRHSTPWAHVLWYAGNVGYDCVHRCWSYAMPWAMPAHRTNENTKHIETEPE